MQLLLKPEQRKRLERVAQRQGRTFSDVARRALEEGLRVMEGETDALWEQRLEALDFLNGLRKRIQDEHGIYEGDLMKDVRAERDSQIEQVWRNE